MSGNSARLIVVQWCDDATMMRLARARGYSKDGDASLLDLVEEWEAEQTRQFASMVRAKAWAVRNRNLDLWGQPSIVVYEWPDERRQDWKRETVEHLRYVGDASGTGSAWEDLL